MHCSGFYVDLKFIIQEQAPRATNESLFIESEISVKKKRKEKRRKKTVTGYVGECIDYVTIN